MAMQKSVFFSTPSEPENMVVAKKIFILTLIVTGIYLLVGFKWFYTLLFSSLTEWQYYFAWPIYRFSLATCLFFLVPWYMVCKKWRIPVKDLGWQWGKAKIGVILSATCSVLVIAEGYIIATNPSFSNFTVYYPMERVFVDPVNFGAFNVTGYIIMEALYVIMYYIPYEFFFRGVSQFPLLDKGNVRVTWIVLYTTLITTAVHYSDVPLNELIAAFAFGFILGPVALKLRSIRYGLFFHAAFGIVTDLACLMLLQKWI